MANKPLKTIKFPGLDDTYTVPQVDAALATSGAAADAKKVGDELTNLKQDFNKYGADNISPKYYGTVYPASLTVVGEGTKATINGTQTGGGYAHYNVFMNSSSFPSGISAGQSLQISQECSHSGVHFRFYEYVNGAESMLADISGTGTQQIKLSDNATGCIVRLSMLASGTTYTNTVSNFFIFDTLTKQQISAGIAKNASDIDNLTSFMPYGYSPLTFTPISGLVNRWNEVSTPEGYAYASISVSAGEKYKANGWYQGGNYPAYVILNGSSVVTYGSPASTGAFNGLEITIPNNATTLIVNGYTDNPVSVSKYGMVSASSNEGKDCVIVGTDTDYLYNDVGTAVLNNPDSIIYVNFGTYETEVSGLATDKKLIGKDRDLCVLTGTNKDYDTPPIEIAGGIVKNFTVSMQNDESAEHKGYCLHSDNSACANNTLLIENCEFTCVGQHSVGMGIYPGEEIIFKNCVFNNKGVEGQMPIYMHNSGASDGIGTVRFHGCYFNGEKYAMRLQAWGSNSSVKFEFIDCTCVSETYGTADDCVWTDYVSGSTHDTTHMHDFIGKFTLLPTSHGNNVSVLNYSA